jgi:PAS domain S-box-containing protein
MRPFAQESTIFAICGETGGNLVDHTSAVPMWCSDAETGLIVEANRAALRYWGYDRDTFIGMRAAQLLCEEELKRQRKLSRTAIRGLTGPWKCRRADGSVIFVTIRWERTMREGRLYDLVTLHSSGEQMETLKRVLEKPVKPRKHPKAIRAS